MFTHYAPRLRSARVVFGALLLTLGLVAGPLTAHGVGATFSTCDVDPTVALSNGWQVTLAAHISSDPSTVQNITYVLHGPTGVSVTRVTYDGGPLSNSETVLYVPDNGYYADTSVATVGSSVPVTVSVVAANPDGTTAWHGSGSGLSNQHLTVGLSH